MVEEVNFQLILSCSCKSIYYYAKTIGNWMFSKTSCERQISAEQVTDRSFPFYQIYLSRFSFYVNTDRDHYTYRIPAENTKLAGPPHVCGDRAKQDKVGKI